MLTTRRHIIRFSWSVFPAISPRQTIPNSITPAPDQYFRCMTNSILICLQLEKKKLEYERLREQKRRFEAEMQLLDLQQRKEEQELAQMQEDLTRNKPKATHQSEPSTPPEYRETSSGFPTVFSRPNRYSTSSLTSPLSLFNRPGRSGSQLTSPQAGITNRYSVDEKLPSKSVPGSRRNSDEDEKEEAIRQDPTSHRSTKRYVGFSHFLVHIVRCHKRKYLCGS